MRRTPRLFRCLLLSLSLAMTACGGDRDAVWLVHATDPHLIEGSDAPEIRSVNANEAAEDKQIAANELAPASELADEQLKKPVAKDAQTHPTHGTADERANFYTFQNLLRKIPELPEMKRHPQLVLTGDFGLGEKHLGGEPTVEAERERREILVDAFAAYRGERPLTVYFVPGNNDAFKEQPHELARINRFIETLCEELARRRVPVRILDLTAIYADLGVPFQPDPGRGCGPYAFADLSPSHRLIGFPTHSFKAPKPERKSRNKGSAADLTVAPATAEGNAAPGKAVEPTDGGGGATESQGPASRGPRKQTPKDPKDAAHASWIETLRHLVQQAATEKKKVLVATHIPELDDPFYVKEGKKLGDDYEAPSGYLPWSTWRVQPGTRKAWIEILGRRHLLVVLAGHFHDPTKTTYRLGYGGQAVPRSPEDRSDPASYVVAPPLAVKHQRRNESPARGFGLLQLTTDQVARRLYWYEPKSESFVAESEILERLPSRDDSTASR